MIEHAPVINPEFNDDERVYQDIRKNYPVLGQKPEFLVRYPSLTDDLIGKIDQIRKDAPRQNDVIIWLDKSARPVSWFYRAFYDILSPQDDPSNQLKQPHHSYLNIDRETWQNVLSLSTNESGITWNNLPEQRIQDIRQIFQFYPEINQSNVFVVDEVKNTGTTLDISTGMIQRAFPEAQVHGLYWMNNGYKIDSKSGQTMNAEVPLWYSDKQITGRLVANIDSSKSQQSVSLTQKLGRFFLSTRFKDGPDQAGLQLKKEIFQLAHDVKNNNLPFVPGILDDQYGQESIEQRIARINNISVEEFIELRRQTGNNYLRFIDLYQQQLKK